jgi:DNA-directed RNA polymerase subunit RPC12/RpoP
MHQLEKERQVSFMQEDVLGTRRTAVTETYVTCARCGKATRLRHAHIIQSDVLSESHSEFEYLCPECQKALAEGEKDLPLM